MKKFIKPEVRVIKLESNDIICTSSTYNNFEEDIDDSRQAPARGVYGVSNDMWD